MRALYANEPEATKEHTGVMVALPVPEKYRPLIAALQSQVPFGTEMVPAEELHVTLLYLGDSSDIEHLKTRIYAGSLKAVEWQDGIPAKLTGLARFNGSEGGKNPLVLLVDSPLLPELRQKVFAHLVHERGIPDNQRHGFIPHITLGYIPSDIPTPQIIVPPAKIVFDSFVIAWGDEQLVVPLSGEAAYKAEGKGYGARAGETIAGNLTRGTDGKFSSAGSSQPAASAEDEGASTTRPRRQRLGKTAAANEERRRREREGKKRTAAEEREKKRQARRAEVEGRRRAREAEREADKKRQEEEATRQLEKNRERVLGRTPLKPEAYDALVAFAEAREGDYDPRMIEALAKETGLISLGSDGTFRMNSDSTAFLKAVDRGDVRAALDTLSRAGDRLERDTEREERRRVKEESEKALAFKHGSHNQATHGNRYGKGFGATKRQFKRLSKEERERFKAEARRRRDTRQDRIPPSDTSRIQAMQNRLSEIRRMRNESTGPYKYDLDTDEFTTPNWAHLQQALRDEELDLLTGIRVETDRLLSSNPSPELAREIMRITSRKTWGDITEEDFALAAELTDEEWEALEREVEEEESQSEKSLSVFKDASGRYRWILLSSNAYRDRDGEIVSTKALAQDVARADIDKDYGPLRWWHVPGVDIGDCDFNAMSGRVLVESGTFRSEVIGEAVFKSQSDLQASIGFRHPFTEPDAEGVFHNIRRFERSLVPAGRAANRFTRLLVKQGESKMDANKLEALKTIIGQEAVDEIVAQAMATQKQADAAGIAYKEAEEAPATATTLTPGGVASFITSGANTNSVSVGTFSPTATLALKEAPEGESEGPEDSESEEEETVKEYAGDMSPSDLTSMIASAVTQAMLPLVQALDVTTKMSDFETRMGGMMEEMKSFMGSRAKDDEIALLQEQQARKDQENAQAKAALEAKMVVFESQLNETKKSLAELTGEQPRAMQQGYRASQATDTVIEKPEEHRLKESRPSGFDPNFFAFVTRQDTQPLPPA